MDGQEVFEMADGMGHAVMQRGDPVRDEIGMLFFVRTLPLQPQSPFSQSRGVLPSLGAVRCPSSTRNGPSGLLPTAAQPASS